MGCRFESQPLQFLSEKSLVVLSEIPLSAILGLFRRLFDVAKAKIWHIVSSLDML